MMKNIVNNLFGGLSRKNVISIIIFFCALFSVFMKIGPYVLSVFTIYLLFIGGGIKRNDSVSILLLLFSITYGLMLVYTNGKYSSATIVHFILAASLFYGLGSRIEGAISSSASRILTFVIAILIIANLSVWVFTIRDISSNGFFTGVRYLAILSDEDEAIAATLYGLLSAICMVGLPMFFVLQKTPGVSKKTTIAFFIAFFMAVVTTMHLMNRTAIVVLIICTISVFLYYYRGVKFLWVIGFVALLLFVLIKLGFISQDFVIAYKGRNELDMSEGGGRFERWGDAFLRVFYMPFGWYGKESITGYSFVHNFWLDVARQTGLVPFVLLTTATLKTLVKLFRYLRSNKNDAIVALFLGLNVCFILATMVEPVMEGCPSFAYIMFFVWGIQNSYIDKFNIVTN